MIVEARAMSYALGDGVSTQVCRVFESDRAVVEDLAVAGPQGSAVETWEQVVTAIQAATAYWNAHKHPFVLGRRRRHQPLRRPKNVSFTVKVLRI